MVGRIQWMGLPTVWREIRKTKVVFGVRYVGRLSSFNSPRPNRFPRTLLTIMCITILATCGLLSFERDALLGPSDGVINSDDVKTGIDS